MVQGCFYRVRGWLWRMCACGPLALRRRIWMSFFPHRRRVFPCGNGCFRIMNIKPRHPIVELPWRNRSTPSIYKSKHSTQLQMFNCWKCPVQNYDRLSILVDMSLLSNLLDELKGMPMVIFYQLSSEDPFFSFLLQYTQDCTGCCVGVCHCADNC